MERSIASCCSLTSTSSLFQSSGPLQRCKPFQQCTRRPRGAAVFCSSTRRFGPPGGERSLYMPLAQMHLMLLCAVLCPFCFRLQAINLLYILILLLALSGDRGGGRGGLILPGQGGGQQDGQQSKLIVPGTIESCHTQMHALFQLRPCMALFSSKLLKTLLILSHADLDIYTEGPDWGRDILVGGRGNSGGQQPNKGGNSMGGSLLDVESKSAMNTFRPPPGFMDDDGPKGASPAAPEVQDSQVPALPSVFPSLSSLICCKVMHASMCVMQYHIEEERLMLIWIIRRTSTSIWEEDNF